ncbi:D-alanyl-D-alanine carboxypeptidase family protein [Agrococcus sp. Ld7]|uniref:M15 family metallopeptidase n=1 Tax=Agrococcus sp. Ld7 TaxID=649148 RepID=UPI003868A082
MRKVLTIMLAALLVSGCAQAATPDPTASEQPSPSASAAADAPSAVPSPAAEPSPSPSPSPSTLWDVDSAASLQVIVNKLRPMDPAAFAPELVPVSTENEEGAEVVRPELDAALTRMDAAMRAAIGEGTFVTSSYRSYELQAQYYQNAISSYGQQAADTTSARPGYSEHQTGLAIDLQSTARECRLDHCFGATDAGIWIAEHAWEFGFVVRYPQGADAVTGYAWEPWHLRFVGTEVTTAMHEQGIGTLEEFFGLEPAPGYAS